MKCLAIEKESAVDITYGRRGRKERRQAGVMEEKTESQRCGEREVRGECWMQAEQSEKGAGEKKTAQIDDEEDGRSER